MAVNTITVIVLAVIHFSAHVHFDNYRSVVQKVPNTETRWSHDKFEHVQPPETPMDTSTQ